MFEDNHLFLKVYQSFIFKDIALIKTNISNIEIITINKLVW